MTLSWQPLFRPALPYISNRAQNGNQGSIWAYSLFGRFLVTGLIGAFLITFFRIPCIRAWNQKSPILRGGKPALLVPFGWQIAVQMGWSRQKWKRTPLLGVGVFRDPVLGSCKGGWEDSYPYSPRRTPLFGSHRTRSGAKNSEFRHMFWKYAHNAVISRKYGRLLL